MGIRLVKPSFGYVFCGDCHGNPEGEYCKAQPQGICPRCRNMGEIPKEAADATKPKHRKIVLEKQASNNSLTMQP